MTTINVLIYTDKRDVSLDDDDESKRVTILKRLMKTKRLGFADFSLEVINRYEEFVNPSIPEASKKPRKLNGEILRRFDEIWFFGLYQKTVDQEFDENFFGGRYNELDDDEVKELGKWMATGGVLVAGDHSEFAPGGAATDPRDTYLCLGRALGHRVPRAGQLRQWGGPPTSQPNDSFNTLIKPAGSLEPDDKLQQDAQPQKLEFLPDNRPHRIFQGKDTIIDVFPDHQHEGKLVIPAKLDTSWPPFDGNGDKPKPIFIANGFDAQLGKSQPVLAVYDGDGLGVGRIVADSSWHHYVNINLRGLDQTTLALMGQYYQNLALYLAPLEKRQEMSRNMIAWLVRHPEVQEERSNDAEIVGRVALYYLSQITTGCEREELFALAVAPQGANGGHNRFSALAADNHEAPSPETVIGSIINRHYISASNRLRPDAVRPPAIIHEEIVALGLMDAFSHPSNAKGTSTKNE